MIPMQVGIDHHLDVIWRHTHAAERLNRLLVRLALECMMVLLPDLRIARPSVDQKTHTFAANQEHPVHGRDLDSCVAIVGQVVQQRRFRLGE